MKLSDALTKLKAAGYQERTQQTEMMLLVERAIQQKSIAVIEGGTGIGKTFGYLIPLLLNTNADTHIVIATATVNLQEQLAAIDIPQLQKILGIRINAEVAKGRRRYVCLNRLYNQHSGQGELMMYGVEQASLPSQANQQQIQTLIQCFEAGKWDGDKDALSTSVDHLLWQQLTTDAAGCSNKRCSFFQECPYFKAKRRMGQADIIIANHDILLSDIAMGTGSLLPKADKTFYIIDEAHHFPQKAVQHFSSTVGLRSAQDWLDAMIKGAQATLPLIEGESNVAYDSFAETCQVVKAQLEPVFELVHSNFALHQKENTWLLSEKPEALIQLLKPLAQDCKKILNKLTAVRQKLTERNDINPITNFDQHLAGLGYHIHHSEMLYRTFDLFCHDQAEGEAPIARWFSLAKDSSHKNARPNYLCHAAMISAANILVSQFWDKVEQGAVLCSATLRALGQFEDFLQKTGLEYYPTVQTAAYLSPFEYQKSTLNIPLMKTVPQGEMADAHTQELGELLPKILEQETHGVLVLFTSQRVMAAVYDAMPPNVRKHVLLQGDLPKSTLLQQHKRAVNLNSLSIIFGLQSFAEGVDLPGNYCRHVVITKLPFSVPSTPIEQTWVKWLESQGKNGFQHHTLPEASLRLVQYAGRLIRTQEDVGTLTIMDRRMITKFYGKQLLASLPPFRVQK